MLGSRSANFAIIDSTDVFWSMWRPVPPDNKRWRSSSQGRFFTKLSVNNVETYRYNECFVEACEDHIRQIDKNTNRQKYKTKTALMLEWSIWNYDFSHVLQKILFNFWIVSQTKALKLYLVRKLFAQCKLSIYRYNGCFVQEGED